MSPNDGKTHVIILAEGKIILEYYDAHPNHDH
jgi:hypothetical protein